MLPLIACLPPHLVVCLVASDDAEEPHTPAEKALKECRGATCPNGCLQQLQSSRPVSCLLDMVITQHRAGMSNT